jgi:hypothetical protein
LGGNCGRLQTHQLGGFRKHAPPVRRVRRALCPLPDNARARMMNGARRTGETLCASRE